MPEILTSTQNSFLREFFSRAQEFYLTGGTALSAFYLRHRYSEDLDFFTNDEVAFRRAENIVMDSCAALKISFSSIRLTSYFKHFSIGKGNDFLTLHFAKDVPYHLKPSNHFDGIVVDSLEDIAANKICAVLGRTEMKDLIDLFFLDEAGYGVSEYFTHAQQKDGGLTDETLAYALSQFRIKRIPAFMIKPVTTEELKQFVDSLTEKLIRRSLPPS
jgi:predicted nucleotidyltransferase component of viral defense system